MAELKLSSLSNPGIALGSYWRGGSEQSEHDEGCSHFVFIPIVSSLLCLHYAWEFDLTFIS